PAPGCPTVPPRDRAALRHVPGVRSAYRVALRHVRGFGSRVASRCARRREGSVSLSVPPPPGTGGFGHGDRAALRPAQEGSARATRRLRPAPEGSGTGIAPPCARLRRVRL